MDASTLIAAGSLVVAAGSLAVAALVAVRDGRTRGRLGELEQAAAERDTERLALEQRLAELEEAKQQPRLWIDPVLAGVRKSPANVLRVSLRVENRGQTDAERVHVDVDYAGSQILQSVLDAKPVRAGNHALLDLHNLPLDSIQGDHLAEKVRLRVWCEQSGAEARWP